MIETHLLPASPILRCPKNKRGQTLVEYALTIALISVVAISTMISMGGHVKGVFSTVTSQLAAAQSGGSSGGSGSGGSGGGGGRGGGG